MSINSSHVVLWVVGSFVANSLLDVMVTIRTLNIKPTVFGILKTTVFAYRLNVPSQYKIMNTYFSLLFTWFAAFVAAFAILILFVTKSISSGKENI